MSRLCSSFSNILDNEETKTAAAAKNCKKNCALIQKKHDLIKAAQKKVDDSCAKNIAPDITKVSAGLDKNVQAKLRKQYNQHSKMYDGTKDLPIKDFGLTTKSNQSPVLGKGGRVTDLKTSDPDINKTPTEFSLSGTKLSGETPGQATTKQSPILLASAKTAVSAQKVSAAGTVTPFDNPTVLCHCKCLPADSKVSDRDAKACIARCNMLCGDGNDLSSTDNYNDPSLYNQVCIQAALSLCTLWGTAPLDTVCMSSAAAKCRIDGGGGDGCSAGLTMTVNGECSSSCGAGSGFLGTIKNWWHNIKGETANCGENCFNPKTKCCLASKVVGEKCDGACYDPKKECCVEGKKVSKSCPCYYIEERLDAVNKRIIKYNQHLPLSQTEPGAPTIAITRCWPWGPWTSFDDSVFKTLDPVIQDGIKVHEEEHKQQCRNMGWKGFRDMLKKKEYVLEVPAYTKERDFFEGKKLTEKCK
ncbi:hypothetical protein KKG44_00700 [Patescibacteria group bacterium]|nr:hypothetical protein [Patescibacteria group bacterium]